MEEISIEVAKRFLLLKHHLIGPKYHHLLDFVKEAGCIQFDPIDVCGLNAELVLQSRVANFNKTDLYRELYENRTLVEYFDKNLAIFLQEDWPYFYRRRVWYQNLYHDYLSIKEETLYKIKDLTVFSSSDLKSDEKIPWFQSQISKTKAGLEMLFNQGITGIHHRKRTIRFFSLQENLLDKTLLKNEDLFLDDKEYATWNLLRRIKSVGLLPNKPSDAFLGILDFTKQNRDIAFLALETKNHITPISITGIKDVFYLATCDVALLQQAKLISTVPMRTEFLAPLDNFLWDRKLIKSLFGFSYTWEIYTPLVKRVYGYYVLPILQLDRLIGRIELVNDRVNDCLLVKNIWFEEHVVLNEEEQQSLKDAIGRFRVFSQASRVEYEKRETF